MSEFATLRRAFRIFLVCLILYGWNSGAFSNYELRSTLDLSLRRLDLDRVEKQLFNVSVDASFADAVTLCELQGIAQENMRRCMTGVSRSLRLMNIEAVRELAHDSLHGEDLKEFPIDGINFRNTYAYGYDSVGRASNDAQSTICLVGELQLHFLIAVTLQRPRCNILVFREESTFFDYRLVEIYNEDIGRHAGSVASIVMADLYGEDSSYDMHTVCDIIHVRQITLHSEELFNHAVAKLSSKQSREVGSVPVTVIWERRIPRQCVACMRRSDNCTDSEHPSGYAVLVNATLSRFCYEQYLLRNRLMQLGGSASGAVTSAAAVSVRRRLVWEYSARSDQFARYVLEPYDSGLYSQIMMINQADPTELYYGLLYPDSEVSDWSGASDPNSAGSHRQEHASTAMSVLDSANIQLLASTSPPLDGVYQVDVTTDGATSAGSERHTAALNKSELAVFITYGNRVFDDTAYGLQGALQRIGYSRACVMGDFDLPMYRALRAGAQGGGNCSQFNTNEYVQEFSTAHHDRSQAEKHMVLQIALGPHEPTMLAPHYIAFQVPERSGSCLLGTDYLCSYWHFFDLLIL
jgi:hypothetical protein